MSGEGYKMQSLQGRQVSALFLRHLTSWDHRTCSFKPDQECYKGDIMCANAEHGELQADCDIEELPALSQKKAASIHGDLVGCH